MFRCSTNPPLPPFRASGTPIKTERVPFTSRFAIVCLTDTSVLLLTLTLVHQLHTKSAVMETGASAHEAGATPTIRACQQVGPCVT